jgi:hypothetical protein
MRQKKLWFMFTGVLTVLGMVLMLPAGSVAASKYSCCTSSPVWMETSPMTV